MWADVYSLFSEQGDRGWNEETMTFLMAGFIIHGDHTHAFKNFIRTIAEEERKEDEKDHDGR